MCTHADRGLVFLVFGVGGKEVRMRVGGGAAYELGLYNAAYNVARVVPGFEPSFDGMGFADIGFRCACGKWPGMLSIHGPRGRGHRAFVLRRAVPPALTTGWRCFQQHHGEGF